MAVNPCTLGPKPQFELAAGTPAVGYKLFFYVAGSVNTKQNTYTDSTGGVANTNPIVLNSLGQPTTQIWFTAGQSYKIVYAPDTDTDPPTSPVWNIDNLTGINDTTVAAATEWVSGPAPTYVSATSFTLVGDQTSTFTVGRRLKTTNTSGTIYSTITVSAFAAVTTVTVVNDSGTLDSGLSAVSYGILQATNKSVPPFDGVTYLTTVAGTNTITAVALKSAAPLATGQSFTFTPAATNTGATTLNVNSLGAKNVFSDNVACIGGELKISVPVVVLYDGTQFQILGRRFFKQPSRQVLTAGVGATYTTPALATRINVRLVGGGGGGGAATTNSGTSGNNTTFSTLTGGGGVGGGTNNAPGGAGGTAAGGDINIPGGSGQGGGGGGAGGFTQGGQGASSAFGGGGGGGNNVAVGLSAATNSGGGGGGGGSNGSNSGSGGGAGGYVEKLITAPAATYTYTVGAVANGGAAGVEAAGNGAAGIIIVDEWYD